MSIFEVRARRVGGSNYQVPVEVRPEPSYNSLVFVGWLTHHARGEHTMKIVLQKEIMDAATTLVFQSET